MDAAHCEARRRALMAIGRIRDTQPAVNHPEAVWFTFRANTRAREPTSAHLDDDASRVAVDQLAASPHCRLQSGLVAFFEHRIEPLFVDLLGRAPDRVVANQDLVHRNARRENLLALACDH